MAAASASHQRRKFNSMAKISVLIVDDSVTIRAMIEQILIRNPDFQVAGIASNVGEARKLTRSINFDVMTLDLEMPGIGGLLYLDELANKFHAPIVVVSSATKNSSLASAEAIKRGASECFDKSRLISDIGGFIRVLRKAASMKRSS